MKNIHEGDKVEWTSQSYGTATTKSGEVLVVVPAGLEPWRAYQRKFPEYEMRVRFSIKFDGFAPRNHESYLVAVRDPEHPNRKPGLYLPQVCHLRKIEEKGRS